jgi:hypothetical protein
MELQFIVAKGKSVGIVPSRWNWPSREDEGGVISWLRSDNDMWLKVKPSWTSGTMDALKYESILVQATKPSS